MSDYQDPYRSPNDPYPPQYNDHGVHMNEDGTYHSAPRSSGDYQWNFEQMHSARRKGGGFRAFFTMLFALVLIVVAVFAAYGAYVAYTGNVVDIASLLPSLSARQNPVADPNAIPMPEFPDIPTVQLPEKLPEIVISDRDADAQGMSNAEIFKKVSPSIVGIISYLTPNTSLLDPQNGGTSRSQGSGIILSEDGYLLTNAHVVDNAQSIQAVLSDGTYYDAAIVGSDRQSDLAVLKILDGDQMPEGGYHFTAAEFGNSDQLEVGERVVAIGNPGGVRFATSLTVGYVSALNRVIPSGDSGYSMEFIQTDAAINPGNSGGALINTSGQVIGINSAKINLSGYEGMGFAIPANVAMPIVKDLLTNGKVTNRAMIGITAKEVSAAVAQYYGVPMGLQVQGFADGADIAAKGVQVGDIITHIDGTPIYSLSACADELKKHKPGDSVTISVYRMNMNGRGKSFNVTIILAGS